MARYNFAQRGFRPRPFTIILILVFAIAFFYFFSSFYRDKAHHKNAVPEQTTPETTVEVPAAKTVRAQITATRVNMRDAPSTQTGKVIHRFAGSEFVDVLDKTPEPDAGGYIWYKVRFESFTGWVYGQYAATEPEVVIQP